MYKSINLKKKEFESYSCVTNEKRLDGLSRINIFIGANNSGKSRFIRGLFSSQELEYHTEDFDVEPINDTIKGFKKEIENYYRVRGIQRITGFDYTTLNEIDFISNSKNLKVEVYEKLHLLSTNEISQIYFSSGAMQITTRQIVNDLKDLCGKYLARLHRLEQYESKGVMRENIYVPTLRGLRANDYDNSNHLLGKDNYGLRTLRDYFLIHPTKNLEYNIYTGLSLYNDVKKLLLGPTSERKKIKKFEEFISQNFFGGMDFNIIPNIDDSAVHVKIGDDEYPIYSLGDGIQAIIILTYPLFFNQEKKMNVFYEEPDQYLHPGFQRVFIETLMLEQFKNFQFFLTTHSNHFLDMTLDFDHISVYTFQKRKEKFVIENVENDDKNILEILGVRNSSVFLTNCTIWVEGITDRIYLRKYFEIYQKSKSVIFQEDIHYSFLEYGGGNITHWSFLEEDDCNHSNINIDALCGKLFLISDQDGAGLNKGGEKSKKRERHEKLGEKLGEQYYCLKVREIENLLSSNTIIALIKEYEGNDCSSIDFSGIKRSKYAKLPLGSFIDENVENLKRSYAAESGTVKDKVNFAKKAVKYIDSIDDVSEEAQQLMGRIYDFVKKNNS